MNETAHPVEELSAYVDDDLSPASRARVESHVAACAGCAAIVEDLRAVVAHARALSSRPPAADLWPGIASRLADRDERVVVFPSWRQRFSFTLPQLAAAGFLLALLSASGVWFALRGVGTAPGGPATSPLARSSGPTASPSDERFATARYEAAIQDLQSLLEQNRDRLDPATVRTVEQNLAVVDAAIEQARQALLADPSSQYLNGHLAAQMQRKLRVLQQAAGYATADFSAADF